MTEITKFEVAMAMKKHGGSFVKCLGDAILYADATNVEIIKKSFAFYWSSLFTISGS